MDRTRWICGTAVGVMATWLGMVGPAAAGEGTEMATVAGRTSGPRVTYGVTASVDGGILLTASTADVALRKVAYKDGRYEVLIERGADRLAIAGGRGAVTVTRGGESVTVSMESSGNEERLAVRRLLLGAPEVEAFRRLTAAVEESGSDRVEAIGLRVTGALVAHLDGDVGAIRRLSRDLLHRFAAGTRRVAFNSQQEQSCWDKYVVEVVKAANELEECAESFSIINPLRAACALYWTIQVEAAWASLWGCTAFPFN